MKPRRCWRQVGLAVACVGGLLATTAGADDVDVAAPPPASSFDPGDPALGAIYQQALALEAREELLASNARYRELAEALPDSVFVRWRISRNYWRAGERLPSGDRDGRMALFQTAEAWASAALELDPDCGECVLWKLAALGRQATTGSPVRAAALASRIRDLIERGIALRPTHRDNDWNVTLANLYSAGSAFYRILPDWLWLQLVIGVRGDKQRALDYIRKAIAIGGPRIDYQVELGAVLLCLGHTEGDAARIEEGRDVLRRAETLDRRLYTDPIDLDHARRLAAEPEHACGYARDGWIDLEQARREVRFMGQR